MKGKGSAASCQSGDECGKGKYEMKVERVMGRGLRNQILAPEINERKPTYVNRGELQSIPQ